jgi:hypothetical protein
MGHVRLGTLPRTRNWIQVLDLVGGGAGAPAVAAATMNAAQRGLEAAAQDKGLVYSVWLLTQLPVAARSADFEGRLRELGLNVSRSASMLEVTGAFADAVDAHLRRNRGRSDLGEMAQMAATEAMTVLGSPANGSLFDTAAPSAREALQALATTAKFSGLAREFFARLATKYLTYFLSRELSNYVGPGGRFAGIDGHAEFTRALDLHCHQASRIVEVFAGGWFAKGQLKGPITQKKASGFVHVALKKLRAELAKGADLGE